GPSCPRHNRSAAPGARPAHRHPASADRPFELRTAFGGGGLQLELPELLPARVHLLARAQMIRAADLLAAHGTQSRARVVAQRRHRLRERPVLRDRFAQVERVTRVDAVRVLFALFRFDVHAGIRIDRRDVLLLELDVDGKRDRFQAAAALTVRCTADMRAHEDPARRAVEPRVPAHVPALALDHQVVVDIVLAGGAGVLFEEGGDVELHGAPPVGESASAYRSRIHPRQSPARLVTPRAFWPIIASTSWTPALSL